MREYCFSFRSVPAAPRGRRALPEAGIPASMGRTPAALAKNGCGYCLRLSGRHANAAAELLQGVQGIWRRTPAGYTEVSRDLL